MIDLKDRSSTIVCPYCKDSDDFCSSCRGTKEIGEFEYIGNLMLQAMLHDSINIRQKILWIFVHSSIKNAIDLLKQSMNEDLKKLEDMGVKILSCGTCLDYYGVKDKLKVGEIANMYLIADAMNEAENTITL